MILEPFELINGKGGELCMKTGSVGLQAQIESDQVDF
jgi:hypothetical protein